jgi:hypothetical protein
MGRKALPADDPLGRWADFNARLQSANEEEIRRLMRLEVKGRKRPQYLDRLYGRFSLLRRLRERERLLKGGVIPK